jgi:hypothetical protein
MQGEVRLFHERQQAELARARDKYFDEVIGGET